MLGGNGARIVSELNGFFSLRTVRDLLAKLEHDYKRVLSADPKTPDAQYAAFDFFVCAEHLADWFKNEQGGTLSAHRGYSDGALVSHVANGAKHFQVFVKRHTTVRDTGTAYAYQDDAFQASAYQGVTLVIELEDGSTVSVCEVASRVLAHWRAIA